MLPLFNSLPYRSNQLQTDGTTASSAVQQVIPPNNNHCQGNPTNLVQNSAQIQSLMGGGIAVGIINNPQFATRTPCRPPFNNNSSSRSISVPPPPPLPLLGQGQCHSSVGGGFMTPMPSIQPPATHLFPHTSVNFLPQYLSQNAGLPNGQFCFQTSPNPMQNIINNNQFLQLPRPNHPFNIPLYPNQVSQPFGPRPPPQNPTFLANPQFGLVHSNALVWPSNQDQQNFVLPAMDVNAARQSHNSNQQSQGNSPLPPAFGSVLPQQTHKDFYPPVFNISQEISPRQGRIRPTPTKRPQGNLRKNSGITSLHTNWKNSQASNITKNPKRDELHRGFPKNHNMQNAKGKFGFHNKHGGKGYKNDGRKKFELANSTNQTPVQRTRSLSLNYTEQEIQQWREERRKSYPSRANMEKKLAKKMTEPEVTDRYAKLRRQQLKEILAKQAELGCEVAEIPSYYLSDSEKQVDGKKENKKALSKKERFQNKFNKRGRFRQNDRFPKKQKLAEHDSCNIHDDHDERFSKKQKLSDYDLSRKLSLNERKPSLLQRLLSTDIRREKSRLLQVFRFMVMNSFFKDLHEKPLKFPLVMVKETGSQGGGKSLRTVESDNGDSEFDYNNSDNRNDEFDAQVKAAAAAYFGSLKGSSGIGDEAEEEEGEIID